MTGKEMSDAEFLADMATYATDHEPDGWPAVQQWRIDRLLALVYRVADNEDGRLTVHILRNWPKDKINTFAKHLLGDTCQRCKVFK
jgi:hypothetical protein